MKIAGNNYSVLNKSLKDMKGKTAFTNFNTQEVWLCNSFTEHQTKVALFQESLNIINQHYNLDLNTRQVTSLTYALAAFIEDNTQP